VAIGTGVNASAAQAAEVHGYLRGLLSEVASKEIARGSAFLYAASVKPTTPTRCWPSRRSTARSSGSQPQRAGLHRDRAKRRAAPPREGSSSMVIALTCCTCSCASPSSPWCLPPERKAPTSARFAPGSQAVFGSMGSDSGRQDHAVWRSCSRSRRSAWRCWRRALELGRARAGPGHRTGDSTRSLDARSRHARPGAPAPGDNARGLREFRDVPSSGLALALLVLAPL